MDVHFLIYFLSKPIQQAKVMTQESGPGHACRRPGWCSLLLTSTLSMCCGEHLQSEPEGCKLYQVLQFSFKEMKMHA